MTAGSNPYESDRLVADYLAFHFGADHHAGVPLPREALDFPIRLVRELIDCGRPVERALDVGCAVGATSFELARHATAVVGVDFSHAFIGAARTLARDGRLGSSVPVEGRITTAFEAVVPVEIDRSRVTFFQGDAMDLPADLGPFDLVIAANLICRLPDPMRFLDRLPDLVNPGGQLLLATPFSWLEEYTPETHWLGGRPDGVRGWDRLREILSSYFELAFTKDLPFLIREHARKYQYGISLGSRWIRR
ncbi:MAG: putative 4-mercaptohistidine N1-methyltransferase [Terrimicrobiaceae bacterium]|nr:putative 4-mercaptohistidine N1-methyltransferase [Terrimicrobiaceae bacterium]